jgi:hypothetical protein
MHKNRHNVPDYAMAFNVVASIIVALFGSPVRIYIFSNVGYLLAIVTALAGYFVMRQFQPERVSPFRLPGWLRWVALASALFLGFTFFVGGWNSPGIVVGPGTSHFLFILGVLIVLAYVPLYAWRSITDRRRGVVTIDVHEPIASPGAAAIAYTIEQDRLARSAAAESVETGEPA